MTRPQPRQDLDEYFAIKLVNAKFTAANFQTSLEIAQSQCAIQYFQRAIDFFEKRIGSEIAQNLGITQITQLS